jgi:hypothetical protein
MIALSPAAARRHMPHRLLSHQTIVLRKPRSCSQRCMPSSQHHCLPAYTRCHRPGLHTVSHCMVLHQRIAIQASWYYQLPLAAHSNTACQSIPQPPALAPLPDAAGALAAHLLWCWHLLHHLLWCCHLLHHLLWCWHLLHHHLPVSCLIAAVWALRLAPHNLRTCSDCYHAFPYPYTNCKHPPRLATRGSLTYTA